MSRLTFSRAAVEDRRAITEYTARRFGVEQARRLRHQFEAVLNLLVDSPRIGPKREDLDPPGHSFRYHTVMKVFVVVYEPIDGGISIARLIHGARRLADELDHKPGDPE